MIIIVTLLSIVLSFSALYCVRTYLAGNRLSSGDTFFHLLVIKTIKKHHWKYPSSLQNVIFYSDIKPYNYLAYPSLFHYLVALFPTRFHLTMAKFFNLAILSLVSGLAAIFTYNITSSLFLAIFSSFIVTFNLSTFVNTVWFTARPLGLLFYSLVVYVTILYPQNLFSIFAITVFVMLINLTHKFATQVVVFGLLPYVFIFNRLHFLLSIALGFLLAIFVSRGFYFKILKEHYNWLYYFSLYPKKSRIAVKLRTIFSRNFWYLPIVASMAYLLLMKDESLLYSDLIAKVTFWAFIPVFIAFVVSIPALSFLGEEYRYVMYGVAPVGIASSLYTASSNVYVWFVSFVCVVMSFLALFKLKRYLHDSKALVDHDEILSYHSLKNYSLSNLLVFPHIRTLEVNYFTKLRVVHPVRPRPWNSKDIGNLLNTYRIQHILKFKGDDQTFATIKNNINMNKISEFSNFELYKLTPKKKGILNQT